MSNFSVRLMSLLVVLTFWNAAMAGQSLSWNLSRDMMNGITTNPAGTWTFMQNATGIHNPAYYTLMPKYSSPCIKYNFTPLNNFICWQDTASPDGIIGVATTTFTEDTVTQGRAIPMLHPGISSQTILRWSSPISGSVNILGKVSDIHVGCGDGIKWALEIGVSTIQSGTLPDGTGTLFVAQNIPVSSLTAIYFIVDKGGNNACDSTNVDLIITSQQ